MRSYRFVQLDVFTDRAFCGNPLAVFPDTDNLTDAEMQQIAREMNLSETVFVESARDTRALRRLRIFTPMRELPFAGHPVVGTWNLLAREGVVQQPADGNGWTRIEQEVGIGTLPVEIEFVGGEPVQVVMTQGKFETPQEVADVSGWAEVARSLGLKPEDLDEGLPVQTVSTGIPVLLVPVRTMAALGRCSIDQAALSEIYKRSGALSCYAFTCETIGGKPSQAHARLFAPDDGIAEDPATGSAAGSLSGYLVYHSALTVESTDGVYNFVIEQGDFIGRPSRIKAQVKGGPGRIEQVRIGGSSVVVAHGELLF